MEKLVRGVQNVNRKRWPLVVHLLVFITILETVVAQLSNTSSAGTDFEALVNIRNSFASTSLSTNWTGSNFCSNWIGVTCNNESRVVNLTLSSKSLAGTIPLALGNLTSLETLDLHDNQLIGSIPNVFYNLSFLKVLDLGQNLLHGPIPDSVCSSSSSSLLKLSLENNNLTETIPTHLTLCTNLKGIYLGGNNFTGSIPNSFRNLSNLVTLDISFNRLTGTVPSLPDSLETLALKNNILTGNLSNLSGNLLPSSLHILSLSANSLEGEIPGDLGNLSKLNKLELNDNRFHGSIPDTWHRETQASLDTLDFSVNNLSGIIPPSIQNLTDLTVLKLDRNHLSGSIPGSLVNMRLLHTINLAQNNLTGEIPPQLVNLLHVSMLNLSWNQLTGVVPDGFFSLEQWIGAILRFDNNSGLEMNVAAAPAVIAHEVSQPADGKSWTLTIILTVDGLLALVDAYALLLYWRVRKPKKEKNEPVSMCEPSIEFSVSVEVLRKATNNFHEDNIVGRGARSIVYKGTVGIGQIAVKVLRKENAERSRELLLRELHTMGNVRHRNVLRILAVCPEMDSLVLEFMPFSSLEFYLYKMVGRVCLSWDTRFKILVGIAQGLVYLHREHQETIIHCDLKPSNILLDADFEPKVADFGIAKYVHTGTSGDDSMCRLCGTTGYIPPEYAWASLASTKGDVFSFGIVLLETLTARKPYENWDVEEGQPGSLVEVVRSAYPDKIMSILDANMVALELVGGLYRQEVTLVMKIGLLCTQDDPRNRPDMIDVLNMLTEIKIADDGGNKARGLDSEETEVEELKARGTR
ncbi:hypothetical protein AXG93_1024s1200 [Marchantia polymorpha subsp. ruderalis]|uniref:non-specific serine/threonine protein kinase n=1 Tax=Marchantia polymorpha subsp. ruderalis TaxID=1480154 RepID=A0A176VPW8_MARPO|nr:hypothetical protein AXG93_1024s1200 [Marchantia polymorpha subsp. ruderalis]